MYDISNRIFLYHSCTYVDTYSMREKNILGGSMSKNTIKEKQVTVVCNLDNTGHRIKNALISVTKKCPPFLPNPCQLVNFAYFRF